jgi:hypothetical protein
MLLDPAKDIKIGTPGYSYAGHPPKGWYRAAGLGNGWQETDT